MAIPFLNNIDLNNNEIQNVRLQNGSNPPLNSGSGQIYFNTGDTIAKYYSNATDTWVSLVQTDFANGTYVSLTNSGTSIKRVYTVDLSATGTKDATTYLRGDNTWATLADIYSWNLSANGATAESVENDDTVDFIQGGTTTITRSGKDITISSADQYDGTVKSVLATHAGDAFTASIGGTAVDPSVDITMNGAATDYIDGEGNLTTFPAIPTVSNATITLTGGAGLANAGGAFTLDQSGDEEITFDIGSGDGITVNANDVAVDVDDVTIQIVASEVAAKTAAVANSGTALATGDQIYDFVTGQIANIPSGLSFEGSWNASTDTPDLSTATPDNGQFWIVSVAGNTNLDGITDWAVGDWAIYVSTGAGTDGWQKVDNSSTLSGFGDTNQVTYWTSTGNVAGDSDFTFNPTSNDLGVGNNITAGGTVTDANGNGVQWTDAYDNYVASAAVTGGASKTMTFTQRDGGTFTADWTDNDSGGTVTSIETTAPITGGTITSTGTIGITTADTGTIGAGAVAAGDGISVAYASGIATVTNTETNADNSFSGLIGNGLATSIDLQNTGATAPNINHGLGSVSSSFMIQLVEVSSGETVYADVTRGASGLVTIDFAVAPATNAIRVLIQKIG